MELNYQVISFVELSFHGKDVHCNDLPIHQSAAQVLVAGNKIQVITYSCRADAAS